MNDSSTNCRSGKIGTGDGKSAKVKAYFEDSRGYLRRRYNIRIRAEAVRGFLGSSEPRSILDVGCGNGAISLPLLGRENRLVLVDVSGPMLDAALASAPAELRGNLRAVHNDFLAEDFGSESFDLVLCLGVLAHVEKPPDVIEKMVRLLRPGGSIIVQNTDAAHPLSRMLRRFEQGRCRFQRRRWAGNTISGSSLVDLLTRRGLRLKASYRYSVLLPGMGRLVSDEQAYRIVRSLFGDVSENTRKRLGAECIYHLRLPEEDLA